MSALEKGIICKFAENGYPLFVDASPVEYPNFPVENTVKCLPHLYHSTDSPNSYWSVSFSFPVLVYSYSIFTKNYEYHALSNWVLYQKDLTGNWINSSHRENFNTINNQKKILIQTPMKTHLLKLVGGVDSDGKHHYLKFHQIEFYGKIMFSRTVQRIKEMRKYNCLMLILLKN